MIPDGPHRFDRRRLLGGSAYVGTYVGRERIRASVKQRYGKAGRLGPGITLHQKVQPMVTVAPDGQSARVRERLFQLNSSPTTAGSYIGGIHEDECLLEDGVWRGVTFAPFPQIASMGFHYRNPVSGRTPDNLLP